MGAHNLCFEQKYESTCIRIFYLKIFIFFCVIFNIFEKACFDNVYFNFGTP